ncbi:hypothetical protein ACFQYP_12200 [Nonomuraea antimicrobica]
MVNALPYALVTLLVWLGRRWAAIACAWAVAAYVVTKLAALPAGTIVLGDVLLVYGTPWIPGGTLLPALPELLCAALLTLAPSYRPGPAGSRRILAGAVGLPVAGVVAGLLPGVAGPVLMAAALGTVAVPVLRSSVGRRTAALLSPFIAVAVTPFWFTEVVSLTAVTVATAALLGGAAWLTRTAKPA